MPKRLKTPRRVSRRKSAVQRPFSAVFPASALRAVEPNVPPPQRPWDHIFSVLSDTDDIISRLRESVERQIGNIDWGSPEVAAAKAEKLGSSLNVLAERIHDHRRILIAIANTLENAG